MSKAVYIHIPFCKNICSYCDFCKNYYNESIANEYLKALDREIKKNYNGEILNSIYIGGGTPSCLSTKQLKYLFKILKILKIDKEYEFTFECNVEDINEELLKILKRNKVNRLSIGVQSFNKKILKILNRKNIDYSKIKLSKKYFENISVDIIYGVSSQKMYDLKKDLKKIIKLNIPHVSLYSLILEDNTILKINNYKELEDEKQRKMYDYINKRLKKKGYNHYEISNYAKKGFESKHNLVYWNNERYYGFGLSACGYISNKRYENTRSINKYISGNYIKESHVVSKKEDMENFMILGLRKLDGVYNSDFYKRYHKNIEDIFDVSKLKNDNKRYYIDENDIFISNSILVDFID